MIKSIKIRNFKSIENMVFNFEAGNNIICLLGKNGSGKSTLFKAISFFFDNINKKFSDEIVVDKINPYIQKCTITITFDFHLLKIKSKNNQKLEPEFANLAKFSNYDEIEITMTQYKDGIITWSIDNSGVLQTIKNVFPLYYIDTRYLDLFSWDKLWKIINDLSISMPQIDEESIIKKFDETFEAVYGKKYTESKKILQSVFSENMISVDKYHFEDKLASAFSMRFGGKYFLINDRGLDFYSDGTNSFKYLVMLISLIPQISSTSCKFPIILVDEPEIGLHNTFICEFVSCVCRNIKQNALLFTSTHSPKIISEFANSREKYELYKINNYRLYSTINKMNLSWLESKALVSIKETECYFSDYLVYLEGETELQVFNNPDILSLYPKLSKVHFYAFDGNDSRMRNVYSNILNLGIGYKVIVDIDKILKYNQQTKKFKLANDGLLNPVKNNSKSKSDLFRFYKSTVDSEFDMCSVRTDIELLLKKEYNPVNDKHYLEGNYENLFKKISEYCEFNNFIVNRTTIEGELITLENIDKFLLFLDTLSLTKEGKDQHNEVRAIEDIKEKTAKVICECNGRTEMQNCAEITYKRIVGEKTSGWVSEWLKFYFDEFIGSARGEESKEQFIKDFPHLNNTLQIIESMVK